MTKIILFLLITNFLFVSLVTAQPSEKSLKVDSLFQKGREYYTNKDYTNAITCFAAAIKILDKQVDPALCDWMASACRAAYDGTGNIYYLKEAVKALEKSLSGEVSPETRFQLGRTQFMLGMRLEKAIADTIQSIALTGYNYAEMGIDNMWQGMDLFERKNFWGSDTTKRLDNYLLSITESCFEIAPYAKYPNSYLAIIENACRRGVNSQNSNTREYFNRELEILEFNRPNLACVQRREQGKLIGQSIIARIQRENTNRTNIQVHTTTRDSLDMAWDYLGKAAELARTDSAKAAIYLDMAYLAIYREPDSVTVYVEKAMNLMDLAHESSEEMREKCGDYLWRVGDGKYKAGELEAALQIFKRLTDFPWSDRDKAFSQLSVIYQSWGDLAQAEAAARRAFELNNREHWKVLYNILILRGKYAEAESLRLQFEKLEKQK